MSQYSFGNLSSPLSGATLIDTHLEPWRDAVHTNHSGTSRPSYAVAKMLWMDTSASPVTLKYFDGTDDITVGTFDESANLFTPSIPNSTITAAMLASATGTGSVVLSASATLTGTPAAPTAAASTNTTQIATTEFVQANKFTAPVEVTTTSGSSKSVTSIPSWVKQIKIGFKGVSTNGTAIMLVQIGDSGGDETSGYDCSSGRFVDAIAPFANLHSTGFGISSALATNTVDGTMILSLIDAATNTWSCLAMFNPVTATAAVAFTSGTKSLSAALDRFSLTTTDTFDAGSFTYSFS